MKRRQKEWLNHKSLGACIQINGYRDSHVMGNNEVINQGGNAEYSSAPKKQSFLRADFYMVQP